VIGRRPFRPVPGNYNPGMADTSHTFEVAIVGAGPIGLELAAELKRAGIDYVQFDKGTIGQTMYWWPPQTQWFSSNERIAIAGVPLHTIDQRKATREEYLAYLRTVARTFDLKIRTHEPVVDIVREADTFRLTTNARGSQHSYAARKVVLAVGDTDVPKRIDIPGEDLPHVAHVLLEPHHYFQRDLLIVGGKNSAAEAALRCWHAGVNVVMSNRDAKFDDQHVKYWLLPELEGRINRGQIACHYQTEPVEITESYVTLRRSDTGETFDVACDFVLLATGFVADMSLFGKVGVALLGDNEVPQFDEATMQTNVAGVYVAGTAAAGTQNRYHLFLENCHIHVHRIVAHLKGEAPPTTPPPNQLPES
jgi:thioredoxin reductase (NADPH)